MAHSSLAKDVMTNFAEALKDVRTKKKPLNMEGRNIILILAPAKKQLRGKL